MLRTMRERSQWLMWVVILGVGAVFVLYLGIGGGCLYRWKRKLAEEGENAFPGRGHLTPEQERVGQLEREVEILRQERDILKKAVAIFSQPSR